MASNIVQQASQEYHFCEVSGGHVYLIFVTAKSLIPKKLNEFIKIN